MNILFSKINPLATVPAYQTSGSSGADLSACIDSQIIIESGCTAIIKTGLSLQLPSGYEAQVRSRSGLAAKNGIFVLNSPGTIDNDYRGEIMVILANFGKNAFIVENGMRIAQIVFSKFEQMQFTAADALSDTIRGSGGFGSTGI